MSTRTCVASALAAIWALVAAASADNAAPRSPLAETWPKNDLERLLVAALYDETKRPDFILALLHSELCALSDRPVPEHPDAANMADGIKLLGVRAPDGLPAAPVFTAAERAVETFGADTTTICLRGDVLLDKLRSGRVVLDPGQPYGILWTAQDVEHILGSSRTIANDTPLRLESPANRPDELIAHLSRALRGRPEITGAWLALATWPRDKTTSWFLEIHGSAAPDVVNVLVRDAVNGVDMQGLPLDTTVRSSDAPVPVGIPLVGN